MERDYKMKKPFLLQDLVSSLVTRHGETGKTALEDSTRFYPPPSGSCEPLLCSLAAAVLPRARCSGALCRSPLRCCHARSLLLCALLRIRKGYCAGKAIAGQEPDEGFRLSLQSCTSKKTFILCLDLDVSLGALGSLLVGRCMWESQAVACFTKLKILNPRPR